MKSEPISSNERNVSIDILRGFALIGIFLVNMPSFHSPIFLDQSPEYIGFDQWLDVFFQMFIQTKFYTIFSFLFGLGFYIFMSRAEQKDLNVKSLFSRRLLILLLIGAVHLILMWYGDILHTYAITGFLLLLFYKRKVITILIWAFSLLFLFYSIIYAQFSIPDKELEEIMQNIALENKQQLVQYTEMYQEGGYIDWVVYRFDLEIVPQFAHLPLVMMPVLAMFLFGLAAGKIGIFHPSPSNRLIIRKIWLISFMLGLPLSIIVGLLKTDILDYDVYQSTAVYFFTGLSGIALCFFYMSSLTLLLYKESWEKLLRPLKFIGQMALTNYLMQTLISNFIFLGLNLYGKVSLTVGTLICLVIFVIQIIFSSIWLRYFRFGPMEWIWRSLTYGYLQPMKVKKQELQSSPDSGILNHVK